MLGSQASPGVSTRTAQPSCFQNSEITGFGPNVWAMASNPTSRSDVEHYAHLIRTEFCPTATHDLLHRGQCVSWMLDCCKEINVSPHTSAIAINYLHRFMQWARSQPEASSLTFKEMIAMVGSRLTGSSGFHDPTALCEALCFTCILVAAKRMEPKDTSCSLYDARSLWPPRLTPSFAGVLEKQLIKALDWNLACSTVYDFVHFWAKRAQSYVNQARLETLCGDIVEGMLRDGSFVSMPPSVFGPAVVTWAIETLAELHETTTELGLKQMFSCMGLAMNQELASAVQRTRRLQCTAFPEYSTTHERAQSPSSTIDFHSTIGFPERSTAAAEGHLAQILPAALRSKRQIGFTEASSVDLSAKPSKPIKRPAPMRADAKKIVAKKVRVEAQCG